VAPARIAFAIRPARPEDEARILALADRLAAFDPATRSAAEIANRERRALAEALGRPAPGSALLVADDPQLGVVGVVFLESRRDYFTNQPHAHVGILAVAREAEGKGLGRALLAASEAWARKEGFSRLTLAVFADNSRAKELYARQGWQVELETHFKDLA
jgi:GNAT superfamily N-acetyltransferase